MEKSVQRSQHSGRKLNPTAAEKKMALAIVRSEEMAEDESLVAARTRSRLIALCVAMFLLNGGLNILLLRNMDVPFSGKTADFAAFYTAGKIVAEGNGKKLYDLNAQTSTELRSTPYAGQPLLYYHPAFETLLFAPLAVLPYQKAYLVWNGVNILMLLSIPLILGKHLRIIGDNLALSMLALACFFPVFITLHQGQDSILLLLCFALAFAAMRSQRDFRAGIFLGLALFKFQFVLPFVFLLAVQRRWRSVGGFAAAAVALAVVSLAITGMSGLWEFPRFLWNANQHWTLGNISPAEMANLRGVIASTVGSPLLAKSLVLLFSALLFAATAFITRRSASPDNMNLGFAVMMLTTMMVSYHLNPHDLSLLALPIALGVNHLVSRGAGRTARGVIVVSSLILLSTPMYLLLLSRQQLYLLFWAILAFGVAMAKAATEGLGGIPISRPSAQF